MARTNHKDFHKKLDELGYNVFVLDYSQGTHYYQYQKKDGTGWNEYSVNTKKKIIDASVDAETRELLKNHYASQGYTII